MFLLFGLALLFTFLTRVVFCVILLLKYSCRQEYLVPPTGSPVPFSPLRNQPTAASLLPSSVQCGSKHLDARLSLFLS